MPNWCSVKMEFETPEDCQKVWEGMQMEQVIAQFDNGCFLERKVLKFSFEKVLPSPKTKEECPDNYILNEEEEEKNKKNGSLKPWFDWYRWNYDHWGVKWDACDSWCDIYEIGFETAWGEPSDQLFLRIANKFHVQFCMSFDDPESGEWQPDLARTYIPE